MRLFPVCSGKTQLVSLLGYSVFPFLLPFTDKTHRRRFFLTRQRESVDAEGALRFFQPKAHSERKLLKNTLPRMRHPILMASFPFHITSSHRVCADGFFFHGFKAVTFDSNLVALLVCFILCMFKFVMFNVIDSFASYTQHTFHLS